jgi:hypothetical protein
VSWQFRNSQRHVCFGFLADWYPRLLDTEVFDWKCHQYRPLRAALSGSTYPIQVPLRIPMKVVSDSDLIPVTCSEVKAVVFGAKRRWRSYGA